MKTNQNEARGRIVPDALPCALRSSAPRSDIHEEASVKTGA
jgi:hypothetical protein